MKQATLYIVMVVIGASAIVIMTTSLMNAYSAAYVINLAGQQRATLLRMYTRTNDIGVDWGVAVNLQDVQRTRSKLLSLSQDLESTFTLFDPQLGEASLTATHRAIETSKEYARRILSFYTQLGIDLRSKSKDDDHRIAVQSMIVLAKLEAYHVTSSMNLTGGCVSLGSHLKATASVSTVAATPSAVWSMLVASSYARLLPICAQRALVGLRTAAPDLYIRTVMTDDAKEISDLRDIHVYPPFYDTFDKETAGYVQEMRSATIVMFCCGNVIIIGFFWVMCMLFKSRGVEHAHMVDAQKAESSAHSSQVAIRAMNHDMKGMIQRIRDTLETKDYEQTDTIMQHFVHVLSTLSVKCEMWSNNNCNVNLRNTKFDVRVVMQLIANVLSDIQIETVGSNSTEIIGDESILYIILYQLCRNACVHGSGPRTMVFDTVKGCLELTNGPGKNHGVLVGLSNKAALAVCMSGKVGTNVSSGQGIVEIQALCKLIGANFTLEFKKDPASVKTRVSNLVKLEEADCCAVTICEPLACEKGEIGVGMADVDDQPLSSKCALLVMDDSRIVRKQSRKIFKEVVRDEKDADALVAAVDAAWCNPIDECNFDRLLVLGDKPPTIMDAIYEWIDKAVKQGYHVIGLIDMNLEYDSGICELGTDVIRQIRTHMSASIEKDHTHTVTLVIRSGNDTIADETQYKEAGADGMISKGQPFKTVVSNVLDYLEH